MMKTQFKKACHVCGVIGHKGADCFTLPKNKEKKEAYLKRMREKRKGKNKNNGQKRNSNDSGEHNTAMVGLNEEMILVANNSKSFNQNTWIADSGATTHMTNSLDGMFDLEDAKVSISVGDGRKMVTLKVGKWRGTAINSEGQEQKIVLTNVSYVPDLMVNLFSLTTAMERGFTINGSKNGITITKGDQS